MASKEQNLAEVTKALADKEKEIEEIKNSLLVGMRRSNHTIEAGVS
jgi:hypothetical protein